MTAIEQWFIVNPYLHHVPYMWLNSIFSQNRITIHLIFFQDLKGQKL